MEVFVVANAVSCLASAACIAAAVLYRRETLLRPTFAVALFLFAYVQLGSALLSGQVWSSLEHPWHYFLATQAVPVLALLFGLTTCRREFVVLAEAIELPDRVEKGRLIGFVVFLLSAAYAVLALYLSIVPFDRTGLYALAHGNPDADLVREETFKLLDVPWVTYLFTLVEKGIAPVAAALSASLVLSAVRRQQVLQVPAYVALIALAAAPTAIYGARGPAAMVALTSILVVVVWVVLKASSAKTRLVILLLPLLATLPVLAMAMSKAGTMDPAFIAGEIGNIADRAFVRGNLDNIWHFQYVEKFGFHGISAIPKLASFFGVDAKDILNVVGRYYGENYYSKFIESTSASGSMVVTNYAIFGWSGHIISMVFIVALDLFVVVYRRLPSYLIVPIVGAMSVPFSALSFSMMPTLFLSKGLLFIPLVFILFAVTCSVFSRRGV